MRVLIVEDDKLLTEFLCRALKKENYEYSVARDGDSGYVKAMSGKYDIILLDIVLPIKSGYTVCRDLRRQGDKTPILILSAKSKEEEKIIGLDIGADDYLTKPFNTAELLARIRALTRRQSSVILQSKLSIDNLAIDPATHLVQRNDQHLDL